ncbi:related to 3'--_5' exonuclease and endonuclease [Melanopsichium pennsylvanicum]|uniref:Related to 3'-->5' exonuclease and endonuclease n=1 Tax=Melanopsichium pennsylvanicum TaxID=63383 RepID=A0AAJ5C6W6_9BASI|nr:related to 3'-->5' exonuclease and endonuclease [Melanopsichium pennsylvanicum]
MTLQPPRFIDIGVNLTDPMFHGNYHGKQVHNEDVSHVLSRASSAGVVSQIITGGNLAESRQALGLAQKVSSYPNVRDGNILSWKGEGEGADAYLDKIKQLILDDKRNNNGKVIAVGECGLDYDRLQFASADIQKKHFEKQLILAIQVQLPLFLHSRAAHDDFVSILKRHIQPLHSALSTLSSSSSSSSSSSVGGRQEIQKQEEQHKDDAFAKRIGVVHSFTGTISEAMSLVSLGLFIGINACSLKTQSNLEVVKSIPLSRILLETDSPWCDLRSTHASYDHIQAFQNSNSNSNLCTLYQPGKSVRKEKWSQSTMVKGRNEPCTIGLIAATIASVKGLEIHHVAQAAMYNTCWLFNLPHP